MIINSKNFYDEISGIYEKMIDFEKNLELRIGAYKKISPEKGRVVDIGCGVGLDSISMAANGHEVVSFDISPNMINEAKRNAEKYDVKIDAGINSFDTIEKEHYGKYDYVISVGNTIAHLKPAELKKALYKTFKILKPGGKIFLHILNYDLIIKSSKRINNIANRDGRIIIRLYDFGKGSIDFNILSFPVDNPREYKIVTTKHYPHDHNEIRNNLRRVGFSKIKFMKNFMGEKFSVKESKDLFIEAKRL